MENETEIIESLIDVLDRMINESQESEIKSCKVL